MASGGGDPDVPGLRRRPLAGHPAMGSTLCHVPAQNPGESHKVSGEKKKKHSRDAIFPYLSRSPDFCKSKSSMKNLRFQSKIGKV